MELMPLWQLFTMSMGKLHAKFEGLEPCDIEKVSIDCRHS